MPSFKRKLSPQHRLRIALHNGQHWLVEQLLNSQSGLADDNLALQLALYRKDAVLRALDANPTLATKEIDARTPLMHLAFSRHIQASPECIPDMLQIAVALLDHGADPNDRFVPDPSETCALPVLYGALCHADNTPLGQLLLQRGANPNDDESLYHATELSHLGGLRLLLAHGANPVGTNALLRALDFNWHDAARLLLAHGANPNADVVAHPSGQPSLMVPALHQAARRMCGAEMIDILVESGADIELGHDGRTAYAYARIYGNAEAAQALRHHGCVTSLTEIEQFLADAADGKPTGGRRLPSSSPGEEIQGLLFNVLHFDDRLDHCRRLAELGYPTDTPGDMGLTPIHIAGWEGHPEIVRWLLDLSPDLQHTNDYGGNLVSTIIHGSENCPLRQRRDHIACMQLALDAGAVISDLDIEYAGNRSMFEFLADRVSNGSANFIQELAT